MADITAGAAGVGAITVAEAMVLDIPVAEAGVTVAAPQPTVGAVLRAVQGAATVAAPVVDFTAEQVVSTVVVGMAADAAN
jgi:hypothetical protein